MRHRPIAVLSQNLRRCFQAAVGFWVALGILSGCKVTGSQEAKLRGVGIPESVADQDCLAWKSVVLFTLNSLIDQGMREDLIEQRRSNSDHPDYKQFTKPLPLIDVTELLSVEKTRQLMDIIIEQEGGKCHKDLLMDTQCMFNHFRGSLVEPRFHATISYVYINRVLDMSLDRERVSEYDDFLKKYHGDHSHIAKGFFHHLYCRQRASVCARRVVYHLTSSLGICLLIKHQTRLKDSGIFDLNDYNPYADSPWMSINEDSLKGFIDRSNELSQ